MTLSAAFHASLSGLTAAARTAGAISSNVANAQTEGYGRRTVELAAQTTGGNGGGVRIAAIRRDTDTALLGALRLAIASRQDAGSQAAFWKEIESAVGVPGTGGALSDRIATLEASLIEAASRPDNDARLMLVLESARGITEQFGMISREIQNARRSADRQIDRDVTALNDGLSRVAELNAEIMRSATAGEMPLALIDQRQQVIDTLAGIVPIREIPRENGQVALITTGGTILLDGRPAAIEFTPSPGMAPASSIEDGQLSGLTVNGNPISAAPGGMLAGGRLGASFELRDMHAVSAQTDLDALAAELARRFQSLDADPTLTAGDPGLFTNAGAAVVPPHAPGLAGRLRVNALADPLQGGSLHRLRDGLGSAQAGAVGSGAILDSMTQAMEAAVAIAPGTTARPMTGLAGDLASRFGTARQTSESALAYRAARANGLQEQFMAQRVDTDSELQLLLLVEKAYAANARVIRAADEMLRSLLEI